MPDLVFAKSQYEGYRAPLPVGEEGDFLRKLQVSPHRGVIWYTLTL